MAEKPAVSAETEKLARCLFEILSSAYDPAEEYWERQLVSGDLHDVLIDGSFNLLTVAARLCECLENHENSHYKTNPPWIAL